MSTADLMAAQLLLTRRELPREFLPGSTARKDRTSFAKTLTKYDDELINLVEYDWRFWARPDQLPPKKSWTYWLLLGGRGGGKTRVLAEMAKMWALQGCQRMMIVARTAADVRDTMIEGPSGILAVSPEWFKPIYQPSRSLLTWPNGVIAYLRSAEQPNKLRGPQFEKLIGDEWCAWRQPRPRRGEQDIPVSAWDNAQFGMRLGKKPQAVLATTPRPTKQLKALIANPHTIVSRSKTYDNLANLSPSFLDTVIKQYEGTRTGRQELDAEILDKPDGALWPVDAFSRCRMHRLNREPQTIVVAIDPSGASGTTDFRSDEIGIVAACDFGEGEYGILGDYTIRAGPRDWANQAAAIVDAWRADYIVAEANFGGAMVQAVIEASGIDVPVRTVHATRGKHIRAAPVALLYEQGRVWHVGPHENYARLEDQLSEFTASGYLGDESPDRADAAIWALTDLAIGKRGGAVGGGSARG